MSLAGLASRPGGLDRDAPVPLYFQLRQAIVDEIRQEGLQPGDRLPTEVELEQRYGVSRSVIRQAVNELAAEGLVVRIQGKGTFVGRPRIQHLPLLTSFTELLRSQGYDPSHRVLASRSAPAPEDVASDLGLVDGAPCRYLQRLLLADGRPVGVSETWIPGEVVAGHEDLFEAGRLGSGSLYALLEGPPLNLHLHRAVETVNPAVAGQRNGELLGCPPRSAVLVLKRITFDGDERPVESTLLTFAGGRYEYRVELYRPPSRTEA